MSKTRSISTQLASRRWTAADAQVVIDALSASGMSIAAFARHKGLEEERVYRWRRRLAAAKRAVDNTPVASAFVEVQAQTPTLVEIVLRGDRLLRIPQSIDGQALLRLVDLLERDGAC
jgi:transposase-like protein